MRILVLSVALGRFFRTGGIVKMLELDHTLRIYATRSRGLEKGKKGIFEFSNFRISQFFFLVVSGPKLTLFYPQWVKDRWSRQGFL